MPFQYILANLLSRNERAIGVLFLDESGETVEFATTGLPPHDLKVLGAYLGIYLRNVGRVLGDGAMGEPRAMHIQKDGIHIHVMALPDGYCLALLQRPPALVGHARKTLTRAVEEIRREAFLPADPG